MNQGSVFIDFKITDIDGTEYQVGHQISNFEQILSIPETDVTSVTIDTYKFWESKEEYNFIKRGNYVTYQYGYRQGDISPIYEGKIIWVNTYYDSNGCREILKIAPIGASVKYGGSQHIWENVTAAQVAKTIAAKHNLIADVDDTTRVYKNLPQAGRSDIEFLRYLAKMEGTSYNVYLTSSGLMFKRIGYYKKSKYLFDISQRNHAVVSISFDWQEITQSKNWVASYTKDGKLDTSVFAEDVENLVDKVTNLELDGRGNLLKILDRNIAPNATTEQEITGTVKSVFDYAKPIHNSIKNSISQSSFAKNLKTEQKINELTARLTVVGFPSYLKDDILTIRGVKSSLEGNYWIQTATHRINANDGFTTSFDLNRNGLKFPNKETNFIESVFDAFNGKENTEEARPEGGKIELDARGNSTTIVTRERAPLTPLLPKYDPEIEGNLTD